jgi:ABC-type lipoprotein export system ATPase subunit
VGEPISPLIRVIDVTRTFQSGNTDIVALSDITVSVMPGEAVALMGPSGSGKTTLLNLIAGLDRPTSGQVRVGATQLDSLGESALTAFRAKTLGLVFQEPYLLPGLTALENVALARLPWEPRRELERRAIELLTSVGLKDRMHHPPGRLSSGERQRVGLARALIGNPPLLLADEPTGNLDASTTSGLLDLLQRLRQATGITLIIATHDSVVADLADRIINLVGGRLASSDSDGSRASGLPGARPHAADTR